MPIPAISVLQGLIQAALAKLEKWWEDHKKSQEMQRVWENFKYLEIVVNEMDARNTALQQQVNQNQQTVILTLIGLLQPIDQQLEALIHPPLASTVAANGASAVQTEQIHLYTNTVRTRLEPELRHAATLVPQEQALDVLTRLVNWQMTGVHIFMAWNANNVRVNGWSILGYYNQRNLCCIAVGGADPASAQIRYYRSMLADIPYTDSGWRRELESSVEQFGRFALLPGNGIYDLPARLHNLGADAD